MAKAKKKVEDEAAGVEEIPLVLIEFDHSKKEFKEAMGISHEDRAEAERVSHLFLSKCFDSGCRSKLAETILQNIHNPHVLFLVTKAIFDMMHQIVENAEAKAEANKD